MTLPAGRMLGCIVCATALLAGCASMPDRKITRSDLSGISYIQVTREPTPLVEVKTLSGGVLMALGGWITGPMGAERDVAATERMRSQTALPDFGELLADNFAQRAPREIPGWPKTIISSDATATRENTAHRAVLSFKLQNQWLTVLRGLTVTVTATLTDADGRVLWRKNFWYRSWDFGRSGNQEDYLKDNYKLLRREIKLAARDTTTVLLRDVSGGL